MHTKEKEVKVSSRKFPKCATRWRYEIKLTWLKTVTPKGKGEIGTNQGSGDIHNTGDHGLGGVPAHRLGHISSFPGTQT